MESDAAACAPEVALPPSATAPAPLAVVAGPIAVALVALESEDEPIDVALLATAFD
nr:hypothetical protein [Burkholderia territorii]